jgi:MFS family permease
VSTKTVSATLPPLRRNRNYNLLWTAMLASQLANEMVLVAALLLVLARSRSGLEIGAVSAVFAGARMAASIPAGVLADRRDRRKIMLTAAGLSGTALAGLAVALYESGYSYLAVLAVAATVGICAAAFDPAEQALLPLVVPRAQLPDAAARNVARPFAAILIGPALAGFAFAWHPFLPFAIAAVLLAGVVGAASRLRVPVSAARPGEDASGSLDEPDAPDDGPGAPDDGPGAPGAAMAGLHWVLGQPVIRATIAWMIVTNLAFNALIIVAIAVSGAAGSSQIGLMVACIGGGGLAGAVCAPKLHAAIPAPVVIIGSSWVFAAAVLAMTLVPAGIPLGALLGAAAFFAPVANTTIMAYQLTTTPDELRGRLSGVVALCSEATGSAGPLAGGLIVAVVGRGSAAILVCAVVLGLAAIGATLTPALRAFPNSSLPLVPDDH